jgi:hypothetical protein
VLRVRFNDPDEWLHELRERPPDLEPVVRITAQFEMTSTYPLQNLSVVATYARLAGPIGHPVMVVELRRYFGQVFAATRPNDPHRDPDNVRGRADELMGRLTAECQALGYATPGGVYEPVVKA